LRSASLPGVAHGKRNLAKLEEVSGSDASRIRWRHIVNVNETMEIRLLVSQSHKKHLS